MAYPTNSIGNFKFVSLAGEWNPVEEQQSIDSRPAVPGMEFTHEGLKGQPFTMVSQVDCNDLAAADTLLQQYKQLTSQGSQILVKNNIPTFNNRVNVLRVTPLQKQKCTTWIGHKISQQAGAMLVCAWDLVCVPFP